MDRRSTTADSVSYADQPTVSPGDALRNQYFDCLASGKSNCTLTSEKLDPLTGSLEITNPYMEQAEIQPKPITGETVLPDSQWTLAFNLTTTQDSESPLDNNRTIYHGARNKAAELLALAETTAGTPITLVVQNAYAESIESETFESTKNNNSPTIVDGQASVSLSESSVHSSEMLINTYLIHDGEIQQLPTRPSEGVANDMEDLLKIAEEQAPSDHLALFAQGHGGGPHGISGDTGSATLDEIEAAIKAGLDVSGRDNLDLLDFDSCSMGNAAVLAALKQTADQIIASPEVESVGGLNADGQNVTAIVNQVLDNPEMSPAELGQTIINLADQGANGGETAPLASDRLVAGTKTLALYNASEITSFNQSLEQLGSYLNQALQSEPNRQAILSAIDSSPLASQAGANGFAGTPRAELHDAKTFASNLLSAVESGTLQDSGGTIKQAATKLLEEQQELISAYHGENTGGYAEQGGLSLFVPGRPYLNVQANADDINAANSIEKLPADESLSTLDNKKAMLISLDRSLSRAEQALGQDFTFAPLTEARAQIESATTQSEYDAARKLLALSAEQFAQSDIGLQLNEITRQVAQENISYAFASEVSPEAQDQWSIFLRNLAAGAS